MSWQLTKEEREEVLQRLAQNISDISFFHYGKKEGVLNLAEAREAAVAVEKKAYTAAQVASTTTTGARPKEEVIQAYTRKLAELALAAVKSKDTQDLASEADVGAEVTQLDLSAGGREFLEEDSATELLQPLLADGAKITKVKFSTKSFGTEAARVAARGLRNNKATLVDVDLSDIIAGRPEQDSLVALQILTSALAEANLEYLNLSDNALGEKGIRACAAALTSQTGLQGLSLQNIGCSVHACKAVDELFTACSQLRQLHLFNNMTDDEGAQYVANMLSRAPKMEDFKLASSRVGAQGGIAIAKALSVGNSLLKLELSDNALTKEVADALAALVRAQPNLQSLNLNDTGLTAQGVTVICSALQDSAPALQELELGLNEIDAASSTHVALAIANKKHLRKLVLRENEMKDAGCLRVCQVLAQSCPNLEVLDLVQNQLSAVGALAAAKAVIAKPSLSLLALDDNFISDEGVDELKDIMEGAGKSEALGPLDENDPDGEADEEEDEADGTAAVEELERLLASTAIKH